MVASLSGDDRMAFSGYKNQRKAMTKRRGGQNKRQEKRGRRERERDRERGGRKHKPEKKNRRSNPGKNTEKTRGTLENK
jgi:hypothetical protein